MWLCKAEDDNARFSHIFCLICLMLPRGGLRSFDSCGSSRRDSIRQQRTLSNGTGGRRCVQSDCVLALHVCACPIVTRCQRRMWAATFLRWRLPAFATAASRATVRNITWCQGRTAARPTASARHLRRALTSSRCLATADTPPSSTRCEGPKQLPTFFPLIGAICPFVTTEAALSDCGQSHALTSNPWSPECGPVHLPRLLGPCSSAADRMAQYTRCTRRLTSRQDKCRASIDHTARDTLRRTGDRWENEFMQLCF